MYDGMVLFYHMTRINKTRDPIRTAQFCLGKDDFSFTPNVIIYVDTMKPFLLAV
jgi:hypothetical protein